MNCVDTDRDEKNCGGCGKQCNGTQACSHGVCCDQGLIGCGGQCVDPRSDPNNCGGCGTTCGMGTPNCVLGTCSGGNNKVLILSDGNAGANTNMKKAIETAGFIVDMQDSGSQAYTGTPAGTGFGAIVVVRVGLLSGGDMASSGQQAILAAQQAGVGIVLDAYDMYENAQYNHFVSLKNLMLYGHTNGIASNGPVTVVGMQFPFFGGVSNGMTTVNQNAWFYGPPINGGTQFANVQTSQGIVPAGWYRGSPNGRIVHFGFGINWSSSQSMWTNDPMQVTWFLNGLRWAARLTN
jgi:hypothetical protein